MSHWAPNFVICSDQSDIISKLLKKLIEKVNDNDEDTISLHNSDYNLLCESVVNEEHQKDCNENININQLSTHKERSQILNDQEHQEDKNENVIIYQSHINGQENKIINREKDKNIENNILQEGELKTKIHWEN